MNDNSTISSNLGFRQYSIFNILIRAVCLLFFFACRTLFRYLQHCHSLSMNIAMCSDALCMSFLLLFFLSCNICGFTFSLLLFSHQWYFLAGACLIIHISNLSIAHVTNEEHSTSTRDTFFSLFCAIFVSSILQVRVRLNKTTQDGIHCRLTMPQTMGVNLNLQLHIEREFKIQIIKNTIHQMEGNPKSVENTKRKMKRIRFMCSFNFLLFFASSILFLVPSDENAIHTCAQESIYLYE